MKKIKARINDKLIDVIFLAKFSLTTKEEKVITKKFLFFKFNVMKMINETKDYYLIFIPWKHQKKELKIISKSDVFEDYEFENIEQIVKIKSFEVKENAKDYERYCDLKVENYTGYDFIYKNQTFIADLYFGEENKCLEILYKEMPNILTEKIVDG